MANFKDSLQSFRNHLRSLDKVEQDEQTSPAQEQLIKRKDHRLQFFDYSTYGYYFVTICTQNHKNLFWDFTSDPDSEEIKYSLSDIGNTVDKEINKICDFYENVEIDKYVIMPNHIHMVIILKENYEDENHEPVKLVPTIGRIIQQFKGSITKQITYSIWQKSFYDHIIKTEREYENIWNYIERNPLLWENDHYFNK